MPYSGFLLICSQRRYNITMKKKIISIISSAVMLAALAPSAFADYYSDFEGYYYTGNTDGTGGASMEIISCSGSAITLRFGRIKNDTETYTYTFSEGTVNGQTAVIPFHAVHANGSEFDGTMTLTFTGGMVKVSNVSSLGTEIYTGTLPKSDKGMEYFSGKTDAYVPNQPSAPQGNGPVYASLTLNGEAVAFDNDARPRIINDYTFVPLRSVFSNMGINVYWDEYSKSDRLMEQLITCTKNDTIIQFSRTFNSSGYNKWELKKWTDSGADTSMSANEIIDVTELQPTIIGDKSYVPLRVISEAFGASIDWNGDTKTVIINCDTYNAHRHDNDVISSIEDFTADEAFNAITADYTDPVLKSSTPYFDAETKFYLYNAVDQWGKVVLKISRGGYIDVIPDTSEAEAEAL